MSLYEFTIPDCLALGLILGLLYAPIYEALRIIRLIFPFKVVVFLCDVVFFVAAAEGVFRLSLLLGNHVRGYTIVGFGAGIFTYIVTFGRLLNAAESGAAVLWRMTIGRFFRYIYEKLEKSLGAFAHNISKAFSKISKNVKSIGKKHSDPLIFDDNIGYNKLDNYGGSVSENVIRANVRKSP